MGIGIKEFKQQILNFAESGEMIDSNDWLFEDFQIWQAVFDLVKKDGYVEDKLEYVGAINPVLTPSGRLFLLEGGYVSTKTFLLFKRGYGIAKFVIIESAKEIIRSIINSMQNPN